MAVLLIAQQDHGVLHHASFAPLLGAAQQLGSDIDVLVASAPEHVQALAQGAASYVGVRAVYAAASPLYDPMMAEHIAPLVVARAKEYQHILMAATTTGKDCAPRIAALLDVQQISDITAIHAPDCFTRPIYAGNALETVQSHEAMHLITVRPTSFAKALRGDLLAPIHRIDAVCSPTPCAIFVSMASQTSERPDLAAASRVVSGGRALGSSENFQLIFDLADALGAGVGASRAAVDAGYIANDHQVGQTGKVVAPDLYIAVGISGAIQHLAGMKESKVIVAINKDENAPIFDIATYGVVGDLFTLVPELIKKSSI